MARVVAVGVPHHVTQRGNNRQQVFFSDAQRRHYLTLLGEHAVRSGLGILGYCLMPNHIHAVVVPTAEVSMAQAFGHTHNAYARHFNALRSRSGHLWQNRFYSTPMDDAHLLRALQYVRNGDRLTFDVETHRMSFSWKLKRP
jgi:putative transposase